MNRRQTNAALAGTRGAAGDGAGSANDQWLYSNSLPPACQFDLKELNELAQRTKAAGDLVGFCWLRKACLYLQAFIHRGGTQ